MADYYTKLYYNLPFQGEQAAFFLDLVDNHTSDKFLTYLKKHNIESSQGASYCDFTPTENCIIVTAEEQVNLQVLTAMIQLTLEAHADDRKLGFEYSLDTSRPTTDGCYGGGLVMITKLSHAIVTTHGLLDTWLKEV